MEVLSTRSAMHARMTGVRCAGQTIALVPTMGALHDGHLALVRRAQHLADHVAVSIFVNPTQFGPDEDFDRYPRDLESDIEILEALDRPVHTVFAPSVEEMYPDGGFPPVWVDVEKLDDRLCGRFREEHFRGVTTVVTKLLLVARPDYAVFGRKDAQQFVIVRHMVRQLGFRAEIVGVPTVREEDGLAVSSRNQYLSEKQRAQSPVLFEALKEAEALIKNGEQRVDRVVEAMRQKLDQASEASVQYVEVVDTDQLQPVDRIQPGQEVLVALAVFFGETRLIDNVFVTAPDNNVSR